MSEIIEKIRKELKIQADEHTLQTGARYFKEAVMLHGVKTSVVTRIGKDYFKTIKDRDKTQVFRMCEELWQSGYMEESFIACEWAYNFRKEYKPGDFKVFETWIRNYVSNWASCDTLCNHSVGAFLDMYPEYVAELKGWAQEDNRWMRRAAAVSLILSARRGDFLDEVFEIADILLLDKDDLVQKGYGWMLKEASKPHQQQVYEYVIGKKQIMPRTALRYAIEKMPEELRKSAMAK